MAEIRSETHFDEDEYALISQAAKARGLSVEEFLKAAALDVARQTVADKKLLPLSERDWGQLLFILENPKDPNDKLIKLMKDE